MKKFKSKKQLKIKLKTLLIFFIILIIAIISSIKLPTINSNIINNILKYSNNYTNNIYNIVEKYIENKFNTPNLLLKSNLKYNVKNNTERMYLAYKKNENPLVYIYNSHQGENYSYKYLEEYNIVPNVMMASNMLKENLDKNGIYTIVEDANILEYMKNNNMKHVDSYIASRYFLSKVLNNYKSIKLFIDLHRDAASHEVTYTNINGKDYAKVMFVIGLENKNYKLNLEIAEKLNNIILNKYPTLTRGIMKKEGYGVNGVYNQDLSYNIILIEVGSNENNIEEINNTIELLASVIGEYLNEKED